MILEIKNLSVDFKKPGTKQVVEAVRGLDLAVGAGSFTSLVGESGSGKTVSALSVCGLVKPHRLSGEVRFYLRDGNSRNLLAAPQAELRQIRGREIGYVFQDPDSSLNPVMKVGRQLDETTRAHFSVTADAARRQTAAFLEAVRLKDAVRVYGSFPHELSGGMKQRALIAMALIAGPRLLIADEPTSALDSSTESEIMKLLSRLKEEKSLTVLFITHNLALALAHSDVIYVMQKGRLVEKMKKTEQGFAPQEAYSKALFKARTLGQHPKTVIEV